jgi:hypothetical protein
MDAPSPGPAPSPSPIPSRAQTLEILRLMGNYRPLLMLPGDDDGYGARWLLDGQQVEPGIAKYLIDAGLVADDGATETGARRLMLTDAGRRLRDSGLRWWARLGFLQRMKVMLFG